MVYKVIGLMSGSSLDGLDIVYVHLEETRGSWKFDILAADCLPYSEEWYKELKNICNLSVPEYLNLHTRYGRYLADCVNNFIEINQLHHKVDFIASHGHTAYHNTEHQTSVQLGCGAALSALTQIPVISELRAMDVALGGKGAPIVPIGDQLLFSSYDYWLNIGGIVNISKIGENGIQAFDVCPGNQVLNALAEKRNKSMDEGGQMARSGNLLPGVLASLNQQEYFQLTAPKSLSNEAAQQLAFPILFESDYAIEDLLHTYCYHVAEQISQSIQHVHTTASPATMLITGGGAFNSFLVEKISVLLQERHITIEVPDAQLVLYKEALVMALIGTLRWREEVNVLSSVTGAKRNSISGALWMGNG